MFNMKVVLIVVIVIVGAGAAIVASYVSGNRGFDSGYRAGVTATQPEVDALQHKIDLQRSCMERIHSGGPTAGSIKEADIDIAGGDNWSAYARMTGDIIGQMMGCDKRSGFDSLELSDLQRWINPLEHVPGLPPQQ
jgi:hypothetical protein